MAVLDVQTKIIDDALNRAMEFEATYGEPVAVPPTLEVKVEDLLQRRTAFYARAEEKVDRIIVWGGLKHVFLSKYKIFLYTQAFSTVVWYVKSEYGFLFFYHVV